MNVIKQILVASFLLILFACNPLKKLETTQSSAQSSFEAANYGEALVLYEKLIQLYKESNKIVPVDIKISAGKSAYEIENYDTAKGFFTNAFNEDKNIGVLMLLIDTYKRLDDNEGLKSVIENNIDLLKKSGKGDFANTELFNINYMLGDWDAAYSKYNNIESPDNSLFEEYLDVLMKLDKKKEAKVLCSEVLKNDNSNITALEWLAIDEYTTAESWYKRMMAKYNRNKNATSYAYLRRDLKKVSVQYRSARDKFIKLRTINPENKQYIRYLKNCYLRLDTKDKAAEMDKLLK